MKKIFAAAIAAIAVTGAMPALAQTVTPTPAPGVVGNVVMNLTANVSQICGAVDFLNPVPLNFGDLATIPSTSSVTLANGISIICNDPTGGTITFASANGGELRRNGTLTGEGNTIPYTFGAGSALGNVPAGTTMTTAGITRTFGGSNAYRNGQTGSITFVVPGVLQSNVGQVNDGERTTVFEGTYTDVVTVSVTAN